jgi:hypothetical protein
MAGPSADLQAQMQAFPVGYWEKSYNPCPRYATTYSVEIKVGDMKSAENAVKRILTKAGEQLSNASTTQTPKYSKKFTYQLSVDEADRASRAFISLGELQTFSIQELIQPGVWKEIQAKLKQLTQETQDNAEALKKMPAANYFLAGALEKLKQVNDSYNSSQGKAQLNLTIIEESEPKK